MNPNAAPGLPHYIEPADLVPAAARAIDFTPAASREELEGMWQQIYRKQRGYDRESAQVMARMRYDDNAPFEGSK
ncbi:hypothetical protein [Luteimonas terricola]|uniref:Uncharacterized protein n=1 Tax=Luteimonas terricola TaxID=645597 RepID=A0ABQ2EEU5_9GAMM|nr:hypothetical protein [Luteimonas terricola]GGK08740.1 hypothetical protein GCM10011394_17680 [Luteimonas terricola]